MLKSDADLFLELVEEQIEGLESCISTAWAGPVDRGPRLARLRALRTRLKRQLGAHEAYRAMISRMRGSTEL